MRRPRRRRPRPGPKYVVPPVRLASDQQQQEPRITVTWDNAKIEDVVAGFAAFSGRSIVLGKGITGNVTAEVKNQPWTQAFQAVLISQGLSATEMPGGIIRVDSPKALDSLTQIEAAGDRGGPGELRPRHGPCGRVSPAS